MVADYRAIIRPQVTKASINETLTFSVAQAEAYVGVFGQDWQWTFIDAQTGDVLDTSSDANPTYVHTKIGVIKVTVYYEASGTTFEGERLISIGWPSMRFTALSRGDASRDVNDSSDPSADQEPMNVAIANLRAMISPCAWWRGPVRSYKMLDEDGFVDAGFHNTDSSHQGTTYDWITRVGFEVLPQDSPPFPPSDVGKVKPFSEFIALGLSVPPIGTIGGCLNSQATAWSTPSTDKGFLPCNGSKPGDMDDPYVSDSDVGRCPHYNGCLGWKYNLDDKLGFSVEGEGSKIGAEQVQELRINSDDWTKYSDPMEEFERRFDVDTIIWPWIDYVRDSEGNIVLNPPVQGLIKYVQVEPSEFSQTGLAIDWGSQEVIDFGTTVIDDTPNYPTLVKEVTSISRPIVDFPKGSEDDPFIHRQFKIDRNFTELYGHVLGGAPGQIVYGLNITKILLSMAQRIGQNFVPWRPGGPPIGGAVLSHEDFVSLLLEYMPDLIQTAILSNDLTYSFGMDYNSGTTNWSINRGNLIPLVHEYYGGIQSLPGAHISNEIWVLFPGSGGSEGNMAFDTTWVRHRFLHAHVYQTRFQGNCDNTDSVFFDFEADVEVQLATGWEGIEKIVIASPDLGGHYAAWRTNLSGKKEVYYLEVHEETTTVPSEDVYPLYRGRDFFVRIDTPNANRISKYQVTSATIDGYDSNGEFSYELEVVEHHGNEDVWDSWTPDGWPESSPIGCSYTDGYPMPANWLHLKLPADADEEGIPSISVCSTNFVVTLHFYYLIHKTGPETSGLGVKSPRHPDQTIVIDPTGPDYAVSNPSDSYSLYDGRQTGPSVSTPYIRSYTISGGDINHKVNYLIFIRDDEGRVVGKKQSAVLFGVGVPACNNHEIKYAWFTRYTGQTLGPRGTRFCNCCISQWSCEGTPYFEGVRVGGFVITGACFDHGFLLDKVWWPFNQCFPQNYIRPVSHFATIFETVPIEPNQSYKYLAGYPYFYEGVDNTGFRNCEQGTYHRNYTPQTRGSAQGWEQWAGYQGIRSGDLRGIDASIGSSIGAFGTGGPVFGVAELGAAYGGPKAMNQFFWPTQRERMLLFVGTDKSMGFLDVQTGWSSVPTGIDGVTGQNFLSLPAGVDLNEIATEEYVCPLNYLSLVRHGEGIGFFGDEHLETDDSFRKSGRYYITPAYVGGGDETDWGWPLIQWVYKNTATPILDPITNAIIGYTYSGEFEDGTRQIAWLYRDKKSADIEREQPNYSPEDPINHTLSSVFLTYPSERQDFSPVPEDVFPDLLPEPSLKYTQRVKEGQHTLRYTAPRFNNLGQSFVGEPGLAGSLGSLSLQEDGQDNEGPYRNICPTGYFIQPDGSAGPGIPAGTLQTNPPYESGMKVFLTEEIANCLTTDNQDVFIETREPPTTVVDSDDLIRRILLVQHPLDYHSLPYVVTNAVGFNAHPNVQGIRCYYKYSHWPQYGIDNGLSQTNPVRYPANTPDSALNSAWTAPVAAWPSYGETQMHIRIAMGNDILTPVAAFVKETFVTSVNVTVFHGLSGLGPGAMHGDVPTTKLEVKPKNGDWQDVETISGIVAPPTSGTGSNYVISFDGIDLPIMEIRLTFSRPAGSRDDSDLLLVNVDVQGRVQVDRSEVITSYDLMYRPSTMRQVLGTDINGTIDNAIPGLVRSQVDDPSKPRSTMGGDDYVGDVRREVSATKLAINRPIIPLVTGNPNVPGGEYDSFQGSSDGAYAGAFKGGIVGAGRRKGDLEYQSTRVRNLPGLCHGSEEVRDDNWGHGDRGPLECAQEGAYEYAARFIARENNMVYQVWMHPDEVEAFRLAGCNTETLPNYDGGRIIESRVIVEVPRTLEEFRGDNSDNYISETGPFVAKGHYMTQKYGGDCWCWVGKTHPICGDIGLPCIDRYLVHDHQGGGEFYVNDFGTVLRRFYTAFNRAVIISSISTLSFWNQEVYSMYESTGGVNPFQFWGSIPAPWLNTVTTADNASIINQSGPGMYWLYGGFKSFKQI